MWWNQTKRITAKQEAQIPVIREKWRGIIFPTEPNDRHKATLAIKSAYELIGLPEPEIIFFDSPYEALKTVLAQLLEQLDSQWVNQLEKHLVRQLNHELESELMRQLISQLVVALKKQLEKQFGLPLESKLDSELKNLLNSQQISQEISQIKKQLENQHLLHLVRQQESLLNSQLVSRLIGSLKSKMQTKQVNKFLSQLSIILENQKASQLIRKLGNQLGKTLFHNNCIHSELWAGEGSWLDFCISILNCAHDSRKWQILQDLIGHCGWILPYEKTCIVCQRPIKLSFDGQHLLHADGEYAILFADGYGLYFHHGIALPRKYGQLHPNNWQADWILEENNAELRRVLIQGIGYDRICQELKAVELDSWQEYSLLKIDKIIDDIDGQPIHLLKMTCPSTQLIHALRVPPGFQSAREAIRWVNWGIDPKQFALQS
jgi:hypothetical protein